MIDLDRALDARAASTSRMVLTVHDELVLEVPLDEREEVEPRSCASRWSTSPSCASRSSSTSASAPTGPRPSTEAPKRLGVHRTGPAADETSVMERKPVPPVAWVLSGATAISVLVLSGIQLSRYGQHSFFDSGDPRLFFFTARDLFGSGRGFEAVGRLTEIPYRYGRMGLPLLAWLGALGRPGLVGWTLIGVNLAALIAIPGLGAQLLTEYDAPPAAAACCCSWYPTSCSCTAASSPSRSSSRCCCSRTCWTRRAPARNARRARVRDPREGSRGARARVRCSGARAGGATSPGTLVVTSAVLPYAAWCVWTRSRLGSYPFLTHTRAREGALGLPFAGIRHTVDHRPTAVAAILALVAATVVLCGTGAWLARGTPIAGLAALFGLVTICLGPEALKYVGETFRVLLVPEVFGLLALIIGLRGSVSLRSRRAGAPPQLVGSAS